jgi:hypothetical protein
MLGALFSLAGGIVFVVVRAVRRAESNDATL